MDEKEIRELHRKAITYIKGLNGPVKKLESYLDATEPYYLDTVQPLIETSESQKFWKRFSLAIAGLNMTYEKIALLLPNDKKSEMVRACAESKKISVKAIDGMLLIRVPHPPRRENRYYCGDRLALMTAIGELCHELELYPQKTIWLVHAYNDQTKNLARLPDFDNYDCKSLIDEACRLYPDTDSPVSTNIRIDTLLTGDLLPMTYLLISPRGFPEEKVHPLLREAFPK